MTYDKESFMKGLITGLRLGRPVSIPVILTDGTLTFYSRSLVGNQYFTETDVITVPQGVWIAFVKSIWSTSIFSIQRHFVWLEGETKSYHYRSITQWEGEQERISEGTATLSSYYAPYRGYRFANSGTSFPNPSQTEIKFTGIKIFGEYNDSEVSMNQASHLVIDEIIRLGL